MRFIFHHPAYLRALQLSVISFFILFSFSAMAQPRADFTPDKTGGCSPLFVSFTNITIGASTNAVYHWDFGNGNTSILQNPGAVFYEEKAYTVLLTVTDGTQTSTHTSIITVSKKPPVDFTFSPGNGCLPLQVNFTGSSSPANGTISAYHWDFGDGVTQQSANSSITHSYNFEQTATVSVTAVNDYGCSNTITKPGIITVHSPVQAAFIADKTIVCKAPGTVQFTNSSIGPGTLSYQWDFGDGAASVAAAPSHTYARSGTYTVKLTVRSSEGCTDVSVRTDYINVENFNTNFQVPALICINDGVTFNNISTPVSDQSIWVFDGTYSYTTYGNYPAYYWYSTAGTYTVQLTNTYGSCQETITKTVVVKSRPELNGFLEEITTLCGAPVKVNFRDTTAGAVSWQWNFNWWSNNSIVHSTVKAPSYTYLSDNNYYVSLTVANADGCSANTIKSVGISRPLVGIFLDTDSRDEECGQLTVKFVPRSTEEITVYAWNFGDGSTSNESQPVHIYNQPGIYTVSLTYTTINGCTGTVTYSSIKVRQKPVANFTVPPTICGNTPVQFINASTGYATNYIWNFGDNTGNNWNGNPQHQYQDEGEYTVTLIAYNGMCNDTITKSNIIKVFPPFPKIAGFANTCEGTRGTVTFTDGSRLANSWHWNFGDGITTSYTAPRATIAHTYNPTGTYKVILTTTNGACTVKDSATVYVLLKQNPVLTANATSICADGGSLNIQVSNLIRSTIPNFYLPPHYYYNIIKGDGSNFNGNVYNAGWDNIPWTATLSNFTAGDENLRVVTQSNYFNCTDTTNIVPLRVKGPTAGLSIVTHNVCFKSPVVLRDMSTRGYGVPIVKWEWNFGDGSTASYTQGGNVSHRYANPGYYYITLKVTDADGCTSSTYYYNNMVNVTGPQAAFNTSSGNTVQLNTTVNFYNYTNTYNTSEVTYLWNFDNGITSTEYSPTHTFTVPGEYVVTLIAENAQTQCRDTARQTITVRNFNTGFTTNVSFIGDHNNCPPVLATFFNTSSNYTRLVWDFGDGFTLENQNYPSHIYNTPGTYIVTLYVYGYNGLTGTYKDTVFVNKPQASIQADDIDGCIGHQVLLNAPAHNNTTSYIWDFGDGHIVNTTDSFSVHQYLTAGSYAPSLMVTSSNGCSASKALPDKIVIYPDPIINISPTVAVVCKNNAVQLQASGAVSYLWSPADGLNDVSVSSPFASPANTTNYTVNATDDKGCKGKNNITVTVPKSFVINAAGTVDICKGTSVQLNVTGANSYQWINTTSGLSHTQTGNPTASPLSNTIYTVVGYDQYQCYTDTAEIAVTVHALPTVNAGPDMEVAYGSAAQLSASSSNDVVRWNWTPSDYLSCINCPSPVSRPQSEMNYVITVYNSHNCEAKDTVNLKGICTEGSIYIPGAFTPNHDGKNDVFTINGSGVRIIKSLRIYNRWGEIVFEKKNFYPNDNSSAWNGTYKGAEAATAAYVYFAEMECEAGETFIRKGTVTLIR
jgi:gliding motility-associated-like protein